MNNNSLYYIENLSKKIVLPYEEIEILKDINLKISKGEQIAIVGASGSGKTTLLHILGGLDFPTKGKVLFKGVDITKMTEKERANFRNKHVGFVFQFHHLLPEFNVIENVAMPLLIANTPKKIAYKKAQEVLEVIGMYRKKGQMVPTLSGGERQLVAIARALVTSPEVILADEPTGNLDYQNAINIATIFKKLNKEMGITILMVTHNLELASMMTHTLVLKDGMIVC